MIEPWPYFAQQKALEELPMDAASVAARERALEAEQMDEEESRAFLSHLVTTALWSLAFSLGLLVTIALRLHAG
jgi:hypothetical protein